MDYVVARQARRTLLLLLFFRPLVSLLQIFPCFLKRSEGVVVGLCSLPVLAHGPLALAGNIENLSQLNMTPDLRPPRLSVSVNRRAVSVSRRLIFR